MLNLAGIQITPLGSNCLLLLRTIFMCPEDTASSKISSKEIHVTLAFEVEAALVECALKIFTSTPAHVNTVSSHQDFIERKTTLCGIM